MSERIHLMWPPPLSGKARKSGLFCPSFPWAPCGRQLLHGPGSAVRRRHLLELGGVRTGGECGLAGRGVAVNAQQAGSHGSRRPGKGSLPSPRHPGRLSSLHLPPHALTSIIVFKSLVCTITAPGIMVRRSGLGPRLYFNPPSVASSDITGWYPSTPWPSIPHQQHSFICSVSSSVNFWKITAWETLPAFCCVLGKWHRFHEKFLNTSF